MDRDHHNQKTTIDAAMPIHVRMATIVKRAGAAHLWNGTPAHDQTDGHRAQRQAPQHQVLGGYNLGRAFIRNLRVNLPAQRDAIRDHNEQNKTGNAYTGAGYGNYRYDRRRQKADQPDNVK